MATLVAPRNPRWVRVTTAGRYLYPGARYRTGLWWNCDPAETKTSDEPQTVWAVNTANPGSFEVMAYDDAGLCLKSCETGKLLSYRNNSVCLRACYEVTEELATYRWISHRPLVW